ncbi:unnamed protein product [Cuscuta campestris]|uniref:Uncharacterized protein n=1 Tax=Cuscuta campestris TaxID=132261 RepID=A0A484MKP5_9ASTE|nr:unnamed protein product [Cuscuta campestris]
MTKISASGDSAKIRNLVSSAALMFWAGSISRTLLRRLCSNPRCRSFGDGGEEIPIGSEFSLLPQLW